MSQDKGPRPNAFLTLKSDDETRGVQLIEPGRHIYVWTPGDGGPDDVPREDLVEFLIGAMTQWHQTELALAVAQQELRRYAIADHITAVTDRTIQ